MVNFSKYIFNLLPPYFHRADSYKDSNGEGLAQRHLKSLGLEWDEEVIPKIEGVIDLLDIDTTPDEFLTYLAGYFGNPPDILGEENYRKVLKFIIPIYKIKGTLEGYRLFFEILGYNLNIIIVDNQDLVYDSGDQYDDDLKYDQSCLTCTEYDIIFVKLDHDCENPTLSILDEATIEKLRKVIKFNEPVNAKLRDFIASLPYCEDVNLCLDETIEIKVEKLVTYDNINYDEGWSYDSSIQTQLESIQVDCEDQFANSPNQINALNWVEEQVYIDPVSQPGYQISQ